MLPSPWQLTTPDRTPSAPIRGGFALVEVMVSLVVLTLCGYLLSALITATLAQNVVRQETAVAADAARNILEDMRGADFGDVFALYNQSPDDDPRGPGTGPGSSFAVPGLDPQEGDADGFVGRIVLPSPGPSLHETSAVTELLMPRDLNGDSWVDGTDHAKDYLVLPVEVVIEWDGYVGGRSFRLSTVLAEMNAQ